MVDQELMENIEDVLANVEVDEAEVQLLDKNSALTRYANSRIHQNIGQEDVTISIRTVAGKSVGSTSTNALDKGSIEDCLRRAEKIARNQQDDPDFKGLPGEAEIRESQDDYVEDTVDYAPDQRAEKVNEMIRYAGEQGVDRMYGAFQTERLDLFVANTKGVRRSSRISNAHLTSTAIADWEGDQGFGWGESYSPDVNDIDHMAVAERAVRKGLSNMEPEGIEPGEFDVVLEPLAVKTMLMYLSIMGFSGKKVQEERSFMCGKFGEKIVDDRVSIYDDALDDDMVGYPFDYEGVPKQRVDLIKDGVANAVVYDTYTAGREEAKTSTGHALPMPNPMSPMPLNLLMDTGGASISEMIEDMDDGILVSRFNYCRPVHPVKSILTGLTRDGTWRIRDGEVAEPVKNLRFTQNLLEALSKVESIGKERELYPLGYYPGYLRVPGLKIPDFNFTGTTEF